MVCYHKPRNTFEQLWMSRFSKQAIISKLRTIERIHRRMGAEKDNVSLNTQQLFAMPRYFTYKGPIVSLDQIV
jgi:hypothetical protein